MQEWISAALRMEFRNFCSRNFYKAQIYDLFTSAGIKKTDVNPDNMIKGERRILVEQFYYSVSWHQKEQANMFLKVLELALRQKYISDETEVGRQFLRDMYVCHGLMVKDGKVIFEDVVEQLQHTTSQKPQLAESKEQFENMLSMEAQARGFEFERFLNRLFEIHNLIPKGAFRLQGEQIDGSFVLHHNPYLLEAKWQNSPTGQSDLLVFDGKVRAKADWTRGLFVSYGGFSSDGLEQFARGRTTKCIGMDGQDLYFILNGQIGFKEALEQKLRYASETNRFFVSVLELIS